MKPLAHIAADFGGGSGRVIAGILTDTSLTIKELHRFPNIRVSADGHDRWDFPRLFAELKEGLRLAAKHYHIVSIGVDTWGVDFGFISPEGTLLALPVTYRDSAVNGAARRFFDTTGMSAAEFYAASGIQIMDIDSVFRLMDLKRNSPALLEAADKMLFMPDLFNFFLTGKATSEVTIASTSGLLNIEKRCWDESMIVRCGLPRHLFAPLVEPGETIGTLSPGIMHEIGVDHEVKVIAVGSHDTASAVAAVSGSFAEDGTIFLSSGTWSLLGASIASPIKTSDAEKADCSNECGVGGSVCFLQNITGMWILQQLVELWQTQGLETDYGKLTAAAAASSWSEPFDVDDASFHAPEDMAQAIVGWYRQRGMTPPTAQPDMVRSVVLSLAKRYARGIRDIARLLGATPRRLQIIGGGSKNTLLNRLTAETAGIRVDAGPAEATAIGNILTQATPQALTDITYKP